MHGTVKYNAIRVLNDNFRSTFIGGQVVMTAGVSELPIDVKAQVLLEGEELQHLRRGQRSPRRARLRQLRGSRRNVLLEDRLLRLRLPLRVGRSGRPGQDDAAQLTVMLAVNTNAPLRGGFFTPQL